MADDPNPALRAELVAYNAELAPQIRGLHDLSATSISAELATAIGKQTTALERRRDLSNTVLQWLDGAWQARKALEADGYPTRTAAVLPASLLSELRGEETDLDAAVGLFAAQPAINLDVANAHTTSQPAPAAPGP